MRHVEHNWVIPFVPDEVTLEFTQFPADPLDMQEHLVESFCWPSANLRFMSELNRDQKTHLHDPQIHELTECRDGFCWFVRATMGFVGGSDHKRFACNAGDPGSILGLGRSPGEGNGYPLQYSCLENSLDRGAWKTTIHEVAKSWTRLSNWAHTHAMKGEAEEPWQDRRKAALRIHWIGSSEQSLQVAAFRINQLWLYLFFGRMHFIILPSS